MRRWWLTLCFAVLALVFVLGCRGVDSAARGGASFRDVDVEAPLLPLAALAPVCWPEDSSPAGRVALTFLGEEVLFEARDGATNSSGRCLRELAASYPPSLRPTGVVTMAPGSQPLDGWAVLAWVKLLAPARFGPERGLVDPAPWVRACMARGPLRAGTRFEVRHVPGPEIRVVPAPVTEAERCVEAVLGSTAWPSGRGLSFELRPSVGAASAPSSEVGLYFAPPSTVVRALAPGAVREAMLMAKPGVSECWDSALVRRAGLGGARTLRFRVDDTGAVARVWVASRGADAEAADYLLDRCLEGVVLGVRFAPGAGDGVYTWVFAARG